MYGITYDSDMDITIDMVNYAIEKEEDNKLWDLYITLFAKMDKKTYISFDKYKEKIYEAAQHKAKVSLLTDDEIRAKAKAIQEKLLGKEATKDGI